MKFSKIFFLGLLITASINVLAEEFIPSDQKPHKSGYKQQKKFGGPASVAAQLEEDDRIKEPALRLPAFDDFFKPWFEWKKTQNKNNGLQLGTDYTTLYQSASDGLSGNETEAASGAFRVFAKWELSGRDTKNKGSLYIKFENRHTLGTDIAPSELGFDIGYNGITGTLYSDVGTVLNDFNWQQSFNDGSSGFIIGRYDPNDYMNVAGFVNPWTTFSNAAIGVDTSIALPDASWGVAAGSWLGDQWQLQAAVNDANGLLDDTSFFQDGSELFKFIELAWSPTRDDRYFKRINLTYWHVDERETKGINQGDGFSFTANWTFDKKWMPFIRGGKSNGAEQTKLMEKTASIGLIARFQQSDLFGLGYSLGDPVGSGSKKQGSTEIFYRIQLSQGVAITPSIQLLTDLVNNPDDDKVMVYGVKARITL